ncbi:MAG: hypothetical protein KGL53_14020, partial [Elusimicrobia bacterium]|nr:hypothetical protein [Elusimicrobiota bacterium]
SLLRRALAPAAVAGGLGALGAAGWRFTKAVAGQTRWERALGAAGWAGYALGNALAFVFAVPQIYKTFLDGGAAKTPAWRAWTGVSASLLLGLVLGPLSGHAFWGVQNVYSGMTLLAPMIVGRLLERRGHPLDPKHAHLWTALTAAALFVPGLGLYYGAAAVMPGLLHAALGAQGVRQLALAIQVATGAMFFLLFMPDIVSILRRKAPQGFTPLFSLLFFAASAGFIAWTLQMAQAAAPGSPERVQYLVYAAQNAAYAVVSFLSYWAARGLARRPGGGHT